MFPRKQYTYRSGGSVDSFSTPIRMLWHDNMPIGSFAYPYKSETGGTSIWNDDNIDDVFAIYTLGGWQFCQADRKEGNIFKMWKMGREGVPGDATGKLYRTSRIAYHLNPNTPCGDIFMREMPRGSNDPEWRFLTFNVLPFLNAYYNYNGSTVEDDVRKYIICSSSDCSVPNEWAYTLHLAPRYVLTSNDNLEIKAISKDTPTGIGKDYYSVEQASRTIVGPFSSSGSYDTPNNIHVSWGEWMGARTNNDDRRKYRYFEIDVLENNNNGMMFTKTDSHLAVYSIFNNDSSYKRLIWILNHQDIPSAGAAETIDTALETIDGRNLYSCHKIGNELRLKLGDQIRMDDVTLFLFDSCENDEERAIIRDTLLAKYGTVIKNMGSPNPYPLLCYKPTIDILPEGSATLELFKEQCTIRRN